MKKREIVLTDDNVRAMLKEAKASNERDYLLLALMANCGLRRAELVGGDDSRVPADKRLPGLQIENFRWEQGGVYILGKKADREVFLPVPSKLLARIFLFISSSHGVKPPPGIKDGGPIPPGIKDGGPIPPGIKDGGPIPINLEGVVGPVFDYSTDGVHRLCLKYARKAAIDDWKRVHPHRFRHFFITRVAKQTGRDPWKTRDLARHKNVATTNRYVAELTPDEKMDISRQIEIL